MCGLVLSNSTCPTVVQACFDEGLLLGKDYLTDARADDQEGAFDDDAKFQWWMLEDSENTSNFAKTPLISPSENCPRVPAECSPG